jgi:pSer/pThr/pTyr-binding forkhead associated (FHA) protein
MRVADRSASAVEIHAQMWAAFRPAPSLGQPEVVLKPLSRPELGEIRVADAGLAIGRNEQPFASYGKRIANTLSREHARLYHKEGCVYLANLESRNGTTVNRIRVGRAHCKLREGDEICFGSVLSYRVEITARPRPSNLRLTLLPTSQDSGLAPIAIAKFPFLIGKADAMFTKYVNESEQGRELGYLSRRHAFIFLKDGQAYVEDLGSSNGTFVDGRRLEHAAPLEEGGVVAFGGEHFVYSVSITGQTLVEVSSGSAGAPAAERDPIAPRADIPPQADIPPHADIAPPADMPPADMLQADEGTQFTAAPTSFLRILCDADRPNEAIAPGGPALPAAVAKAPVLRRRPRGRIITLLSELASLRAGGHPEHAPRRWWWIGAAAGVLSALALLAYVVNAPQRDLKGALARGDFERAAALAARLLEQHPDDVELKAQATEAALKARVPPWLGKVQAHDFGAAQRVLEGMSDLGMRNADLQPLIGELKWLGALERLVSGRGGPDAPIRIYADEDTIEQLLERWNNDTGEHQRALERIAARVPQFGAWYGAALTHLRRLQSESTVYLPVIERVKANIATEMEREDPDALELVLTETAEKYPGLGGLDSVRQDLARYLEILREARQSGRLFAVLHKAQLVIPVFQQSLRALQDGGRLPADDLLRQYDAATQAWKDGNPDVALARLQDMAQGFWAQDIAAELERRRAVTARFAALQQSRNTAGFVDQLLAFRESLDADEDVYFLRATAADMSLQKSAVIARAQEAMNRAGSAWQEYRSNGAIDAAQRIETSISDKFRNAARSLSEASRYARQGFLLYSQVDTAGAAPWAAIREEIEAEAGQQRSKLHDLKHVVEPELLKTKLALLGEPHE